MSRSLKFLGWTLLVIVLVIVAVIYLVPRVANSPQTNNQNNSNSNSQQSQVTDFASCVSAGYEILETFPEQCRTPSGQTYVNTTSPAAEAEIFNIQPGQLVTSPLYVMGQARGNWFFEANIPVILKDQNGKILAQKGFQAKGNWMTEGYVEFEGRLDFTAPTTEFGTLIVHNDNPSGLEENDKEISIPVRFN